MTPSSADQSILDRILDTAKSALVAALREFALSRHRLTLDRFFDVRAAGVMVGELAKMVFDRILEQLSDCGADPFVKCLAALDEDRVIGHLLRQCVLEGVLDVAEGGLLINELT